MSNLLHFLQPANPIFAAIIFTMKIAVRGNERQRLAWNEKNISQLHECEWHEGATFFSATADVFFDLLFDENEIEKNIFTTDKPVFANAVIPLLSELPENYIRINAWNSFFERAQIEMVTRPQQKETVENILQQIGLQFIAAPDVAGMVAARVVSMIINEAYYAAGEGVSSKEEIDIAMKLGVNYPYGPFEWADKIGLQNIYMLLMKMQQEETRYTIAPLLQQEATIK